VSEKISITVIIIAQNEEANIERCIRSCSDIGEILLIDSGSTDKTVTIAKKLGARVIEQAWLGFGPQKRLGVAHSSTDWFLSLDADEYLSPGLLNNIKSLPLTDTTRAYAINRRSFFLGREVRFSGWNPDWVIRLANRRFWNFSDDLLHERLTGQGPVATVDGLLYHNSYPTQTEVGRKTQLYGRLGQQTRTRNKNKILAASWSFFRTLILRLGILDGTTGLGIARMNAKTSYIKYSDSADCQSDSYKSSRDRLR
jgi:glycosyltransferase involved in cell wall biosynthesis